MKLTVFLGVLFSSFFAFGQEKNVDNIVAVVGKEIVLQSDIEQLKAYSQQGNEPKTDCELLEISLSEKMMVHHAKNDTLLKVSKEEVDRQVAQMITQYEEYFKDEQKMIRFFGFKNLSDLKKELFSIQKDKFLVERLKQKITSSLDVSPNETEVFYKKNKDGLPTTKEELELAHIVIYPTITEKNKQVVINKLNEIRENILNKKFTFAEEAILYSEDPGSSANGGLIENVSRGKMVKEFEAQAFSLNEDEISAPFETEYGFHIVKLERKRGQILDLRHILISIKPTNSELEEAKKLADSIHSKLITKKITFSDAAKEFSADKFTKFNGGKMINQETGNNLFEKDKLTTRELFSIVVIDESGISSVFEDIYERKPAFRMLKILQSYPAHQLSITTDYERIKRIALMEKSKEEVDKWIKQQSKKNYVKINESLDYCKPFIKFL